MSKRIFSITMVKNEADIIESFVRYNLNILDGMIILDNHSSDNTLEILNSLKNEGLSIEILEDDDAEFNQTIKTNQLLSFAITQFNADIIVPLDADEFLIDQDNNQNPRKYLETIEFPTYSSVKWKTYVPTFDNENEKFIPSKITHSREDLGEYYKVIIPRQLVEEFDVKLTKGNHKISFNPEFDNSIQQCISKDLRIAHFPIRSKEQLFSKISVGWINNLLDVNRTEHESWHLKELFENLKEGLPVDNESMINFAKNYSMDNPGQEVKIRYDPINLTSFKNTSIKYEVHDLSFMTNILENSEIVAQNFLSLKKANLQEENELKAEINRIESEIRKYQRENNNLLKKVAKLSNENNRLESKIEEYENSTSWLITSPMRKIISILKKLKK